MDYQPAILAFLPEDKDRNALLGRVEGAIAERYGSRHPTSR